MKDNYKTGIKNQWRRTIWNQIHERLSVKPKDALVVYLAGPQDLDREVAKRHGFRDENLISVERENKWLAKLRGEGVLCVHGDFCQAVECISKKHKIDVVFGDFVCGLEMKTIAHHIAGWMLPKNLNRTVFVFNFLRGRDASSNRLRHKVEVYYKSIGPDTRVDPLEARKNRAFCLLYLLMGEFSLNLDSAYYNNENKRNEALLKWLDVVAFDIHSYKSSTENGTVQIFDTLIMRSPQFGFGVDGIKDKSPYILPEIQPKTKFSASAIMAHRTMRLKAA